MDFYKIWKDLKDLPDNEFINNEDKETFLEYLNDSSKVLMEMANVVGNDVIRENRLPFSFYFSSKNAVHRQHGIRIKVLWNPNKAPDSADGYIELHGDYDYVSGSHKYNPTGKELKILRNFCLKYKVLFSAVWEDKLASNYLQKYFDGRLDFKDLLSKFENIKEKQYYLINHCKNLEELEDCVRKNNIFSMND